MTERGQNPLDPMLSKFQKMQQSMNFDARWESGRVAFLLKRLGMSDRIHTLRGMDQFNNLTFAALNEEAELPMAFACHAMQGKLPVHRDIKHAHPNWFKNFHKLPFVVVYFEKRLEYILARGALGDDNPRPFCMVFPRKGFPQGLCIHDGPMLEYVLPGNASGVHLYTPRNMAREFIVQPFVSVVDKFNQVERDEDDGNE